jgi:hypothetical protein
MTLATAVEVFRDYIESVAGGRDGELHRAEDALLACAEAVVAARGRTSAELQNAVLDLRVYADGMCQGTHAGHYEVFCDSADGARRKLSDAIRAVLTAFDTATAQLAAWDASLDELSHWPDLPEVPFAITYDERGVRRTVAIPGAQVQGVLEAIHDRFRRLAPFGQQAAEAVYHQERLTAELAEARKELRNLRAQLGNS